MDEQTRLKIRTAFAGLINAVVDQVYEDVTNAGTSDDAAEAFWTDLAFEIENEALAAFRALHTVAMSMVEGTEKPDVDRLHDIMQRSLEAWCEVNADVSDEDELTNLKKGTVH